MLWFLREEQDEESTRDGDHDVLEVYHCVNRLFDTLGVVRIHVGRENTSQNEREQGSKRSGQCRERCSQGSLIFREPDGRNQTGGCENGGTRDRLTQRAKEDVIEVIVRLGQESDPDSTNLDSDRNAQNCVSAHPIVSLNGEKIHGDVEKRAHKRTHVHNDKGYSKGVGNRYSDSCPSHNQHEVVEDDTCEQSKNDPSEWRRFEDYFFLLVIHSRCKLFRRRRNIRHIRRFVVAFPIQFRLHIHGLVVKVVKTGTYWNFLRAARASDSSLCLSRKDKERHLN